MTAVVEVGVARVGLAVVRALDRDVVGQAHRPRGAAGWVTAWEMTHRPSNRQRNRWVVGLLDVRPTDRIPPALDGPFEAVLAVNSLAFWPAPSVRLVELRERLVPDGRIAVVSQPRRPVATAETSRRVAREIRDLLADAGFTHSSTHMLPLHPPVACVIGRRPPEAGRPG